MFKNHMLLRYHLVIILFLIMIFFPSIRSPEQCWGAPQEETLLDQDMIDISLKKEAHHAIDSALTWLKQKQNQDGSWSSPDYPAITALVALCFLRDLASSPKKEMNYPPFLQNALNYITGKVQPDGGIYTPDKGLSNYNTSICLATLIAAGNPAYNQVIENARSYIISLQKNDAKEKGQNTPYDGGIGYGTKDHSDMSNMYIALEALALSRKKDFDHQKRLLNSSDNKATDLDWEAALKFIERCQHNPKYNDQSWASNDPDNYGGFVYYPGNSKAGEVTLPDGSKTLRSYGSMTYAGLLSFIYAHLEKDDPRVQAAYDWITRHYTVEENPGLGMQGLYYNYHTMAKALAVYGEEQIHVKGRGHKINWRKELTEKLITLQKGDGNWVNDNARWWENDPVLVTAYSVLAMEMALAGY
ncbi:MAG: prenyltransferase/squalene oxidase repeat-containing protein [bacterium]